MNTNPLVSIIIPVYNREQLIANAIEASIRQSYTNLEIIILDNCSTDGTVGVVEKYLQLDSRVTLIKNNENVGPVLNWLKGVKEAQGEYCKILFSDDSISDNYIQSCLNLFSPSSAFVMSGYKIVQNDLVKAESTYQRYSRITTSEYIKNTCLYLRDYCNSPGIALFRRKDIVASFELNLNNEYGLNFNETGAGVDLLISLNIALKYKYIEICKDAYSYFISHSGSISVENESKLRLHYLYARHFFILNYANNLLEDFAVSLFWYQKKFKYLGDIRKHLGLNSTGSYLQKSLYLPKYLITKVLS